MFLVMDHSTAPEPDEVERGHMDPDAIIHLTLDAGVADFVKRVQFSLGYEINPDDLDAPDPEMSAENVAAIAAWRSCLDAERPVGSLSIVTRDHTHTLMKVGDA